MHLGKERVPNMVNTVVFSPGSVIRPKMRMGVGWNWGGGGGEEEKRRRRGGGDEEKEEGGEEHLVGVPGEPLVGAEEQGVRVALGLEVLHGHDDAAVVAHIIVVVPSENLGGWMMMMRMMIRMMIRMMRMRITMRMRMRMRMIWIVRYDIRLYRNVASMVQVQVQTW